MIILGITGNSGTGKSTICNFFLQSGYSVIDTDKLGHEALYKNTFVYTELVNKFGEKILDKNKNIDRKRLGTIVFNEKEDLDFLSRHSHKYIKIRINEELRIAEKENIKLVCIDGALLLDAKINEICTENWLITADYEIRLSRIMERDNLAKEIAEKRLKMQRDYLSVSYEFDLVIDNSLDFSETKEIIKNNINRLIGDV